MEKAEGKKWESLFGEAHDSNSNHPNQSDILNQVMKGAANQKEALRETVGKDLLEKIEEGQQILKSGSTNRKMKASLKQSIISMTRLARSDVVNLDFLQERAILASFRMYEDEDIKKLHEIIARINELITNQTERLRKINCSITIKSIERVKENLIKNTYERLLQKIKKADFKDFLISFISFCCIYSENQAKTFMVRAQQAVKHHPQNADDFLEVLHLRLFSPESTEPHKIDYSVLKQNEFINNPEVMAYKMGDLMVLCMLKNDAITIGGSLWEAGLKEHHVEIIREIDSLSRIVAKKYPADYYPSISRYYQNHPDG